MVNKCNAVGVNIYVDAIINHMTNVGNTGNAGSTYNVNQRSYPAGKINIYKIPSYFHFKNQFSFQKFHMVLLTLTTVVAKLGTVKSATIKM